MLNEPNMPELVYDAEDEYIPEPVAPPSAPSWQDGNFRVGIHTSIAGDIVHSLEIAKKLGCNAMQIFSTSPRMWPRPGRTLIPEADAARFRARREELGIGPVAIHANYLINLATNDAVARVRTIQTFRDEIVRGISLGADFLIVHPGSAREQAMPEATVHVGNALRQAAKGLKLASEENPTGMRILIENTAGMGSAIGSKLEELAAILRGSGEIDVGVCLDTAHLFAAGYPIHTAEGLEQTIAQVENTIGLDRVYVIHVNDSKTPFGSRVDRHEHVGKGKIGAGALARFLRHPMLAPAQLAGRAFLLETPIDEPGDDRRNVAALWKLVGASFEQEPDAEDGFSMVRRSKKKPNTAKKAKRARKVKASNKKNRSRSKTASRTKKHSRKRR